MLRLTFVFLCIFSFGQTIESSDTCLDFEGELWVSPRGNEHYWIENGKRRLVPPTALNSLWGTPTGITKQIWAWPWYMQESLPMGTPLPEYAELFSWSGKGIYLLDQDDDGTPVKRHIYDMYSMAVVHEFVNENIILSVPDEGEEGFKIQTVRRVWEGRTTLLQGKNYVVIDCKFRFADAGTMSQYFAHNAEFEVGENWEIEVNGANAPTTGYDIWGPSQVGLFKYSWSDTVYFLDVGEREDGSTYTTKRPIYPDADSPTAPPSTVSVYFPDVEIPVAGLDSLRYLFVLADELLYDKYPVIFNNDNYVKNGNYENILVPGKDCANAHAAGCGELYLDPTNANAVWGDNVLSVMVPYSYWVGLWEDGKYSGTFYEVRGMSSVPNIRAKFSLGVSSWKALRSPYIDLMYVRLFNDPNFGGNMKIITDEFYDCPSANQCGWPGNSVDSVIVPKEFEVTLYDGEDFTGAMLVLRGPKFVPSLSTTFQFGDKIESWQVRVVHGMGTDYPILFQDMHYCGRMTYLTRNCPDASRCEWFKNMGQSIDIPVGFTVTLYQLANYQGVSVTIEGPRKVDDIGTWLSQYLVNSVNSWQIGEVVTRMIHSYEYGTPTVENVQDLFLDQIELDNPTSTQQSYSMSRTYSFSVSQSHEGTEEWSNSISVGMEFEVEAWFFKSKLSTEFSHSKTTSSTSGSSYEWSRDQTYEFSCVANPFTHTECSVRQKNGTITIPYTALLTTTHGRGSDKIESTRTLSGTLHSIASSHAFFVSKETKLIPPECQGGDYAELVGDTCYMRYKDLDIGFTYDEAVTECYSRMRGAYVPSVHSMQENKLVQDFCDGFDTWIGLTCDSSNRAALWQDGSQRDYANFENGGGCANQGNHATVIQSDSILGKWEVVPKSSIVDCIVCKRDMEMPEPSGRQCSPDDSQKRRETMGVAGSRQTAPPSNAKRRGRSVFT